MVYIRFSCTSPLGDYRNCSYGGDDIESCFDVLNMLVAAGWHLHEVSLREAPDKLLKLPVEAFDGDVVADHLAQLERTWHTLLDYPDDFSSVLGNHEPGWRIRDQALATQARIRLRQEQLKKRTDRLFARLDALQARIETTKAQWGVK
ncbi:hypothetical protein [Spirosoma jeollabukense]